MTYHPIFMLAH